MAVPSSVHEVVDEAPDDVERRKHRSFHRGAEPDALVEVGRLASDDEHAFGEGAEGGHRSEQRTRLEPVRIERVAAGALDDGLHHGDGAGRVSACDGVDEHELLVAVEQLVREVDAADADIDDFDRSGLRRTEALGDLDAEPVVTEEHVPDTGDEHAVVHGAPPSMSSSSAGSK
jgi:hypothetical protein